MEQEQYELAIEEQAYPFEEQAIQVHESNLKLISRGVYNEWIEKSLQKLAKSVPARYDKPEETSGIVSSLETYIFEIDRPAPTAAPGPEPPAPVLVEKPGSITEPEPAEPAHDQESGSVTEFETGEPAQAEESGSVTELDTEEPAEGDHTGLPPIRLIEQQGGKRCMACR